MEKDTGGKVVKAGNISRKWYTVNVIWLGRDDAAGPDTVDEKIYC